MTERRKNTVSTNVVYDYQDKLKEKKEGLPEKIFQHRESVLTFLFKNPHVETIHHIAIILFLGLCVSTFIKGYIEDNNVTYGIRLILGGFRGIHISILIWIFIYSLVCCSYLCFLAWSRIRRFFTPNSTARKICDMSSSVLLFGYYMFSFVFIAQVVDTFNLLTGSSGIILMEQVRLLMKVYAFVRSNAPKVLQHKEKSDKDLVLPTFKHFIFFTWIPTLVYRDEYPRTDKIVWNKVAGYFLEILAVVCFYSFVLERFLIPIYKDFGLRKYSSSELIIVYFESILPGAMILVVTFFLILHLVQNLFAELLCFGDRMFYKDWWTATDFTTFYRKWNVVIHDWLYSYVYKDCYEIWLPGNKSAAKYITFLLSSVVHEWIIANMLGYFMPIMFVLFFGIGTVVTYIKFPRNAFSNMFLWFSLAIGSGFMITAYGLEYYARLNNVPSTTGSFDFFIPRCLTCKDCYS